MQSAGAAAQTVIPGGTTTAVNGTFQIYPSGVLIDGALAVSNGGVAFAGDYSYLGTTAGNSKLSVDGANSSFNLYFHDLNTGFASGANSSIAVTNGGAVSLISNFNAGAAAGNVTNITVDGANSLFASGFQLGLGNAAESVANVTISNGGMMYARALQCCDPNGSGVVFIGMNGTATVNVTGANSQLKSDGDISIGSIYPFPFGTTGTGTLTVSNGGTVTAGDGNRAIVLAYNSGSTGTLNIGAAAGSPAAAPGFVVASEVMMGAGNSGIVFNHTSSNYVFSTLISGGGALTALNGTTVLTAANTYNGATNVNGGVLDVEGSIALSATVIGAGGTLTGSGTVGNVTVSNGGILAPGLPGTVGSALNIAGNLALQPGATYQVAINGSASSIASVTGAAALAGNVVVTGSFVPKTQYNILHAASLNGTTFSGVTVATNYAAALSYTPTDAYLTLSAALGLGAKLSQNQQNVANTINGSYNSNLALPAPFLALFGLSGSDLSARLSQLTGETGTGSQQTTFNAMNQFMGVISDPFISGRGDPVSAGGGATGYADEQAMTYAARRNPRDAMAAIYTKAMPVRTFEQRWSVWTAGYGGSQTTSGNTVVGSNNTASRIYGTAVGADYRLSPDTLAGFALAGGGTNFSVANGLGSGRSDLFQAGAFIRHNVGAAYLSGAVAYGWQEVITNRTLTIAGIDQLRAQFNADAWSGRVEGGYRFVSKGFGWTPYAAGQFTTFDLPAYAERAIVGANTFALAYNTKSVTDTRSELGLRSDKSFAAADGVFTLRGRLAWAHDYDPDRSISATFQALPGASFVANGARQASDSALVTASAEMKWLNGWSAVATFEGEFSRVTTSYAGKGVVRYAW